MKVLDNLEALSDQMLKPINRSAIILLGIYTVVWGLWVFSPFWDVFTAAPLYSAMMGFIPSEYFWGILAMACGSATIRGVLNQSYLSLLFGARIVGLHWLIIAIFYFIGDWSSTGGITSLFFSIYALYVALNIKVNHEYYYETMEDMLR